MLKQSFYQPVWAATPTLAIALLLAACSGTGSPQQNTAVGDPQAEQTVQLQAFQKRGFLDQDVLTMAAYLANDIPNIPRIERAPAGTHSRIIVSANEVRAVENSVVLDNNAFASHLLRELRRYSKRDIAYVDRLDSMRGNHAASDGSGRSGKGGGGGSRGGGSRGGGHASGPPVNYVLQVNVSRLPTEADKQPVQSYEIRVIDAVNKVPLWQGSFELDAPANEAP